MSVPGEAGAAVRSDAPVDVGAYDDLLDGTPVEVKVGKARAVVIRVDEEVHVLHGICPHRGAPLARGRVRPNLTGSPGTIEVDDSIQVLTCPWHNWEFDVASGCALWDPSMRIRKFRSEVIDGRVVVHPRLPARNR